MRRFEAQRGRGTTSFGFFDPEENKMVHHVKEARIKKLLARKKRKEVLYHHRFSTSTVDVRNACHPFSTKDYFDNQYIVVHNGMISNTITLKNQHLERGIKYVSTQPNGSFNDSEALAYDLARYFEGEVDTLTAAGSIAFIAIKMVDGKRTTLLFGRNQGNPLVMKKTKNSITISSTGEGDIVPMNTLHMYDYETGQMRTVAMTIPSSTWTSYSGAKDYSYEYDYRSSKVSKYTQPSLLQQGKTDVEMVKGDKEDVIKALFLKFDGDLQKASDAAFEMRNAAAKEAKRVENRMTNAATPDSDVDSLFDRVIELNAYEQMMEDVSAEFYLMWEEQEDKLTGGDTEWMKHVTAS